MTLSNEPKLHTRIHRKKMSPPQTIVPPSAADEMTGFATIHPDILESHVLRRLDGPTLASAASCSAALRQLSSREYLWSELCHSTWPSTTCSPRISHVISTFPGGGPRAFFSHAFLLPGNASSNRSSSSGAEAPEPPSELISAVDIHYKEELIFSKHQETETRSDWFRCSPFRIDVLEPKDVVPTPMIKHREEHDTCTDFVTDLRLSWILIDPIKRRAVNVSSQEPISARCHWLTKEVKVDFSSILVSDQNHHFQCRIVVTFGSSDAGEMQMREMTLEMEDVDGKHLKGRESIGILDGALVGHKRRNGRNRAEAAKRRYEEYLEMKEDRKQRSVKEEEALDVLCLAFGVSIFVAFCYFMIFT